MKRIISYCAIAAAVLPILAACGKDNGEDRTADYGELSFSATVPSVEGTGIKLDWSAGESISIFDGKANHEFKASESGSETVFTGTADKKAARYMGLSPYNGSLQRYSGKVSVSIPASQEAVAGGMDSDARFMAAYADPDAGTLEFKLLPALLRFSIDGTGYNIVSVQVTAKGGEAIAGDCKIGLFETPVIEAASGSSSKVQMNGSNIGGTYCLAVIPQNLTSGVCVSISDENDARCEIEIPAFEMKSGEVSDLGKFEKLEIGRAHV